MGEDIVKSTRTEMNDFVAFYRRQPKVAGMPSFSTLYTAINTLSGHYASYGNKYPVPEKRRVRLKQQYKEIERARPRQVMLLCAQPRHSRSRSNALHGSRLINA